MDEPFRSLSMDEASSGLSRVLGRLTNESSSPQRGTIPFESEETESHDSSSCVVTPRGSGYEHDDSTVSDESPRVSVNLSRPQSPRRSSGKSSGSSAGVSAVRPSFEEYASPRPLLVVACSYDGKPSLALRGPSREAAAVSEARLLTRRLDDPSMAMLRDALSSCESLHLLCHGDAPLSGERVPLLCNPAAPGGIEALSTEAWVAMIAPHASRLRHVYLGGCSTEELGRALFERAGVAVVVCWRGMTHDRAAERFGVALATELGKGVAPMTSFLAARAACLLETEPGVLDDGRCGEVQKFELVEPGDASQVHRCHQQRNGVCVVTGATPAKCPWRYRLLPQPGQRVPAGWRGRLAAGVPLLFTQCNSPEANECRQTGARQ